MAIFANFQNALISPILAAFGAVVVIFANFQNALISPILAFFLEPFFAQNNCNVLVESFFACFRHF